MYRYKDDIISKIEVKNELIDGTNEFNLMEENFIPSIVIRANNQEYARSSEVFEKTQVNKDNLFVNVDKLQQYISIVLNIRHRTLTSNLFYKQRYRQCEKEDYLSNNYTVEEDFAQVIKGRLCPHFDGDVDYWKIKNSYSNDTERKSFSLEIRKCMETPKNKCKSPNEVQQFLNNVYFTVYYTQTNTELFHPDHEGSVLDAFHGQFQLKLDQYLDNNNFLRLNAVMNQDHRFLIWKKALRYHFLDQIQKQSWLGLPIVFNEISTYDGGKTWGYEKGEKLYGTYWFLHTMQVNHSREAYNIIMLCAVFGGLAKGIVIIAEFIGKYINQKVIMAKFIRSFYFIPKEKKEQPTLKMMLFKKKFNFMDQCNSIKFTFKDKFAGFLKLFCGEKKMTKTE